MITMSPSVDKLAPALLAARRNMKLAGKSGSNTYDGYHYATEMDWHQAVMPALLAEGLVLVTSAEAPVNLDPRQTKGGGNEYPVQLATEALLLHSSGQWLRITAVGQGQDRSDKGLAKAATVAGKLTYQLFFLLPKTAAPEKYSAAGEAPRKQAGAGNTAPASKPPNKRWARWSKAERYEYTLRRLSELRGNAAALNDAGAKMKPDDFAPDDFSKLADTCARLMTEAETQTQQSQKVSS